MRHALVQPRQRRPLERPPDGDPLVVQLHRDRHGDECERRAGHEREASDVALAGGLDRHQGTQQERGTPPCMTGTMPIIHSRFPARNAWRAVKKHIALATTAARCGSRSRATRRPSTSGYATNTAYSTPTKTNSCGQCVSRSMSFVPLPHGEPRWCHRQRRNGPPPLRGREPEDRREVDRVSHDERDKRRLASVAHGRNGTGLTDEEHGCSSLRGDRLPALCTDSDPRDRVRADCRRCSERDQSHWADRRPPTTTPARRRRP